MTDRPLRPLFPKGYLYDTQIIAVLLSADGEHDPDILFINGASAALMVSDIPFAGPVGAVRVGRDQWQVRRQPHPFPAPPERSRPRLCRHAERRHHDRRRRARTPRRGIHRRRSHFAQAEAAKLVAAQVELAAKAGKPKRQAPLFIVRDELMEVAYAVAGDRIEAAIYTPSKVARGKAVDALKAEVSAAIIAKYPEATKFEISQAFDYLQKKAFRVSILDKQTRCDGRASGSDPPTQRRSGPDPALARLRALPARRNAGRRPRHARARRRSPGTRRLHRRRDGQAFHPALQLPAVLRR